MCWITRRPADDESPACSTRRNPDGLYASRVVPGTSTRDPSDEEEKGLATAISAEVASPETGAPIGALL